MRKKTQHILYTLLAGFIPMGLSAQILVDFNDGTAFDNPASVGQSMTVSDLTLTTVDIIGFADPGGELVSSSGSSGDPEFHRTNIAGNVNSLGINSALGGSEDSSNFEVGEAWIIEFDKDIVFDEINFASLHGDQDADGGDEMTVTILDGSNSGAGVVTTFTGPAGTADTQDAFAFGETITAGTDIRFEMTAGGISRIREFTVTAVPEPGLFALGLGGIALGLVVLRRRKG